MTGKINWSIWRPMTPGRAFIAGLCLVAIAFQIVHIIRTWPF